ncbi:MAG TPA: molybdate ABC transporter substrate-binding protein [Enteractinococcus helveticum]|uniref:Molybdate ABC transporter substrate-binding protein n=1 Tax=Enteractinococcus helveticum TaxID=1837282 RepID=A0A921K7S3_9MICC|nr:molybdate ABC transporter substrate-binding protein [Enteractinococcus helveticum]HJF14723.1 molybdate ABC transporter substrate-binding protein [Enteractinococcus helveticum]
MKRTILTITAAIALAMTGCSSGSSHTDRPDSESAPAAEAEITLNVLAAASLQKAFEEISEQFAAEHPNISIDFNFAGSSTLVQNLEAGSPADVVATADEANMDKAQEANLIDVDSRGLFASNKLVGIVPEDNPENISTLEDANADGANLVICAPQVPCGALSQTLAEAAGITLNPVSEEQQVSDVLGKVRSGQADAGLVYTTDAALAADEVEVFDIEGADAELNHYPIARTSNSEHPEAAEAFIEFVYSDLGQATLAANGFSAP